jgi:hypothetical protein
MHVAIPPLPLVQYALILFTYHKYDSIFMLNKAMLSVLI